MSERVCRYGCNTTIEWDTKQSVFKELDGTLHTRERCESLKPRQNQILTNGHNEISLELVLKKLSKIGVQIDLEKLRNV